MAVNVKEYAAFTGVTEGYAEEILKDVEHAKWHMPSGVAKLEKAAELIADMEGTEDGKDSDDGAELDGGSVEGEK